MSSSAQIRSDETVTPDGTRPARKTLAPPGTRLDRHFSVVLSAQCRHASDVPVPHPASPVPSPIQPRHFLGLLLLSMATLLLELALTRVLSVSLWYHFGFLVISTALLGFGASGVTLALWTGLRERKDLDTALAVCALAFAVWVAVSFRLMQAIPSSLSRWRSIIAIWGRRPRSRIAV